MGELESVVTEDRLLWTRHLGLRLCPIASSMELWLFRLHMSWWSSVYSMSILRILSIMAHVQV